MRNIFPSFLVQLVWVLMTRNDIGTPPIHWENIWESINIFPKTRVNRSENAKSRFKRRQDGKVRRRLFWKAFWQKSLTVSGGRRGLAIQQFVQMFPLLLFVHNFLHYFVHYLCTILCIILCIILCRCFHCDYSQLGVLLAAATCLLS